MSKTTSNNGWDEANNEKSRAETAWEILDQIVMDLGSDLDSQHRENFEKIKDHIKARRGSTATATAWTFWTLWSTLWSGRGLPMFGGPSCDHDAPRSLISWTRGTMTGDATETLMLFWGQFSWGLRICQGGQGLNITGPHGQSIY